VTDVLGWILEAATGRGWVELLRRTFWDRIGTEHDATVSLEPNGTPMLGIGLAATTADLARAGVALAERTIVPAAVVDAMRTGGDRAAFRAGGHYAYLEGYSYRDQWWLPGGPTAPLSAWGIYGQLLWIDVEAQLVVAVHSAGADPSDRQRDLDHDALCRALTAHAAGWA
jgi:hypothetical protein